MKWKKFILLIVCLVVIFTVLFGTGKSAKSKKETSLFELTTNSKQILPLLPFYSVKANLHYKGNREASLITGEKILSITVQDPKGKIIETPDATNDIGLSVKVKPGENVRETVFFTALHKGEYLILTNCSVVSVNDINLLKEFTEPQKIMFNP